MTSTKQKPKRIPCALCGNTHQKDAGRIACHGRHVDDAAKLASFGGLPESYRAEAAEQVIVLAARLHAAASRWLGIEIKRESYRAEKAAASNSSGPVRSEPSESKAVEIPTALPLPFEPEEDEDEDIEDPIEAFLRSMK